MEDKRIILDGAMGTMLQKAGLMAGEHPEVYGYENPDIVRDIHLEYIYAGSEVLYTNTFGANSHKLKGCDIDTKTAINSAVLSAKAAIELAKKNGINRTIKIALDVGPIGELLEPLGTLKFEDAYEVYKEVVLAGYEAGADIIAIETITDLYDAKACVLAAKENTNLPVWVTMSYEENGRTFTGTTIASMGITLSGLGVDALGFNCSLGPEEILPFVRELREWTDKPIIVKPNAGLPDPSTGHYNMDAEQFGILMKEFAKEGMYAMGGCCGTSPEYIKELCSNIKDIKAADISRNNLKNGVCSATHVTEFGGVRVIGERLNPTGKKRFANALLEHDMEYITRIALEQEESGADILDVNVGVPGADEVPLMIEVVKALQGIISIPLQIDSSNASAIEAGLRVYNGKAIINSVNADDGRLNEILPIAKKYGAAVIGLALDEGGIPVSSEERVKKAEYIMQRAMEAGIKKDDIIIDCLTLTVSAQQDQALETLEAVRKVHNELGLHCTLGVSNISFGLPERKHINESFLTQAMYCGLDFPIINPNISGMMDVISAFKVLSGEDVNSDKYIQRFSQVKDDAKAQAGASADNSNTVNDIETAIIKGLKEQTKNIAVELLKNYSEMDIINNMLIPALDIVGEQYEKQIIFLPQLINSANAACAAFDLIKERIAKMGGESVSKGKIVIATVKGDIHDIGKNIVKVILENYGYRMIDLGRDVAIEKVADVVEAEDIKLVGLSALMTTTLPAMKDTIEAVKKKAPDCKVWVGGAVLTKEYAMEIGADYYAKDARASVDIAKLVFGENDED